LTSCGSAYIVYLRYMRRWAVAAEDYSVAQTESAGDPPGDEERRLQSDRELAGLAKALGHPARVRILRLLAARTSCICGDVVDELPLAQSTVSQHLRVLRQAGLIRGEVDPPRVCYCVDPATVQRLARLVESLCSLLPPDTASIAGKTKERS
jgi:DNA-binding transcriptional ArsR family regulator